MNEIVTLLWKKKNLILICVYYTEKHENYMIILKCLEIEKKFSAFFLNVLG